MIRVGINGAGRIGRHLIYLVDIYYDEYDEVISNMSKYFDSDLLVRLFEFKSSGKNLSKSDFLELYEFCIIIYNDILKNLDNMGC